MHSNRLLIGYSAAALGFTLYLGYGVNRTDFWPFILVYLLYFSLYLGMALYLEQKDRSDLIPAVIGLGLLLRFVLLFSVPNFSDDYARFLWDGHLINAGIHPFSQTPEYWMSQPGQVAGLSPELYAKLNSQRYFTIYPPVNQFIFWLATFLFPSWEQGGIFVIKIFILASEVGVLYFLHKLGRRVGRPFAGLWYALNPLVILEFTGNCHFEGMMVFFMLAAIWLLLQQKYLGGAALWTLAIATKLSPALFLPVMWRWLGLKRGWHFMLRVGVFSLALFLPILVMAPNMLRSVDLYFRKFQFNASIYYVIRYLGYESTGWDIGHKSGPLLGLLGVLIIWASAWIIRSRAEQAQQTTQLFQAITLGGLGYLLCAATVQPWYLGVPLVFSLLGDWRAVLAWSACIMLSYSHYEHNAYQENFPLITLEYTLFGIILFWDFKRIFVKRTRFDSP
ncbi:MAG: hypothetical protein J0M29_02105 [Chitinophagales bacterium]|nr:hypothetical protein [Chitinophagales bacterium]